MIQYIQNVRVSLQSFNMNGDVEGYMNLYFHPHKRIYLDVIYCYDEYRGNGISKNLSNLADYILQDYSGYIIRGLIIFINLLAMKRLNMKII